MKNFTQSNWIQSLVETEFQLLPEVKYFTLKYLCFHLAKIASNSHINEMNPSNLARIFDPTLYGTLEINPEHNQPQLQFAINYSFLPGNRKAIHEKTKKNFRKRSVSAESIAGLQTQSSDTR
jgi:hypothetical protein